MQKKRVISLLPSATEIVCALDAANQLVGRSHECDYPASILTLPACTISKINADASSGEIDRQVKDLLREALSLYQIDTDQLRRLQPDLILTQAQCEVCAVSLPEVEQAVAKWLGSRPQIVSLSPKRLVDIWEDIRSVADALGVAEHGREILRALKNRVVAIIEKTCVMKQPPSVACIEWIEPLMAAGNWVPELVQLAGGRNLVGDAGSHSPWLNWETLQRHNPEIIVVMPCGFNLLRTRAEMAPLTQRPGWAKLQAVKNRRVYLTDGNQYFNRPGPRIVESLEILAEICHPDRFNFGHKGKGWDKL
ncbi:MAG: transporter, periplasmic solute-binding protein [Pedosphaera sp.]|nr:transporter, periplasmic solute-binding protein [Pedosphaera sp.]